MNKLKLNIRSNEQPVQQVSTIQPTQPTQLVQQPVHNSGQKVVQVTGVVTSIEKKTNFKDPITNMKINCPNMGKTFKATYNFFCPLREKDTIYALCRVEQKGSDQILHLLQPPFAQPAIDKDYVIQCFIRSTKAPFMSARRLYESISLVAGGNDQVIAYLSTLAQSWYDDHNSDTLHMFDKVEPEVIKKLLSWWHKERNLRRLYLFGLNNKEINACRMTCDDIYDAIMINPYVIPAIPLEKCNSIMDTLNKTPQLNEKICGSIVRILWKNLHERGWTCMPIKFLYQQFPDLGQYIETLKQDYGLVIDLNSVYLKFPNRVETWIADYISNKCTSDMITYNTPIDDVTRISAHFTASLCEDQVRAVHGALDHNISIITGPAGTGKCLALGTKILMADGSIKTIESIQVGEQVMGPDSLPRNVLSKCFGMDNMFKIIPSKGKEWTCNTPHVLTLKGIVPYIEYRKDKKNKKYFSRYTNQGIRISKAFMTEKEAREFIDILPEDIFDIPLNEYLKRTEDHKRYNYLFHVGIDFPEKEVFMDPYLIGYWLGDGTSSAPQITTIDEEIVDYFNKVLEDYGAEMSCDKSGMRYSIRGAGKNYYKHGGNEFRNTLRDLNLFNNKHIPDVYKINSRQVRLELLAGLIDSDGHVFHDGKNIEIFQKSEILSDDIEYLCYSLGFMITREDSQKGCEYNGTMSWGFYQRMCIFGDGTEEIPTIIARKNMNKRMINKRATCLSFTVEALPKKQIYSGFELDGDGRFLLSDFLVTHNTTVLGEVIHNLELRNIAYAVCSFTGKAVSRIREVTKSAKPSTIHRLIFNAKKDPFAAVKKTQFEKDTPLTEYTHIVFDETSMITTELLYQLLKVYPSVKKLTFIGDSNQLPPIGWGSLFHQLLKSETIPTYKLTTNFRVTQKNGQLDGIIANSNKLVNHVYGAPFEYTLADNFSVMEGPVERVYEIVRGCFAAKIPAEHVVILTPYNRYLEELNKSFQNIYDVGKPFRVDSRGIKWMIDDRVMLTENDNEIGVFNGETGHIRDITDVAILVDFGTSGCHEFLIEPTEANRTFSRYGTTTNYNHQGNQADKVETEDDDTVDTERTVKKLTHAFSCSIDKSQGSEWRYVILYIPEFNTGSFINIKRIYTAFTRSRTMCWIVTSDVDALHIATVKPAPIRFDNLGKRLSEMLPNLKPFKIISEIESEYRNEMEGFLFDEPDDDLY